MIVDAVLLFNELDLLELRVNELHTVVDKFLIVQSDTTFSGKRKKVYALNDIKRLKRFKDKLVFWNVTDMPKGDDPWLREKHQRNSVADGLRNIGCKSNDRILLSDVDEIPRKSAVEQASKMDSPVIFQLRFYYYYINVRGVTTPWWPNLKMANLSDLLPEPQRLRDMKSNNPKFYTIPDAGWHFSFLGGPQRIQEKISAFSHYREFDKPEFTSEENLKKILDEKKDLFRRKLPLFGHRFSFLGKTVAWQKVNVDNTYPKYLLENIGRFKYMIAS